MPAPILPPWFTAAIDYAVENGSDALFTAKALAPQHQWVLVDPDDPRATWRNTDAALVATNDLPHLRLFRRRLWRTLPTKRRGHERAIPSFDGFLVAVDDRGHGLLELRGRTVEIVLSNFVEVKDTEDTDEAPKPRKQTKKQRLLAELMALLESK